MKKSMKLDFETFQKYLAENHYAPLGVWIKQYFHWLREGNQVILEDGTKLKPNKDCTRFFSFQQKGK